MTCAEVLTLLEETPVIAAVKDEAGLDACLDSSARVAFVLYGTVLDIPGIVARLCAAGKAVFVHLDLIDGLAARDVAVDYIAQSTGAAGILTTRPALVRRARALGLLAIRRYFLLDSMALDTLQKQHADSAGQTGAADMVEVLPGAMPRVLASLVARLDVPLIAGGLIRDKQDVVNALSAGAVAISSTNPAVWNL